MGGDHKGLRPTSVLVIRQHPSNDVRDVHAKFELSVVLKILQIISGTCPSMKQFGSEISLSRLYPLVARCSWYETS